MPAFVIPANFNTAHEEVIKLVRNFADNYEKCLAANYNESAARKDFIDKLFIAHMKVVDNTEIGI